jgi:hypothetical protein
MVHATNVPESICNQIISMRLYKAPFAAIEAHLEVKANTANKIYYNGQ